MLKKRVVTPGSTYGEGDVSYTGLLKKSGVSRSGYMFLGWYSSIYKDHPIYYYADKYSDIKSKYGYDEKKLWNHYINYGIKEGRRIAEYLPTDKVPSTVPSTMYAGWYDTSNFNATANITIADTFKFNSYNSSTRMNNISFKG